MTLPGVWSVVVVESLKVSAQRKAWLAMAACLIGPFGFAAVIRLQSSLPEDTLFGRSVKESGLALPLVILGFAGLWAFPTLTSVIGGDLFAAEDRHGTWTTILTRSRSRVEVFAGKALIAFACTVMLIALLGLSSIAAGVMIIGTAPLINLSGVVLSASQGLQAATWAWASVLSPAFAFTALAVLISVITRSSVAGIGLPTALGMVMQLSTLVDGPEPLRRLLTTSAFGAWHGLLTAPPYYAPLIHGSVVNAIYVVVCLMCAYQVFRRRDMRGPA